MVKTLTRKGWAVVYPMPGGPVVSDKLYTTRAAAIDVLKVAMGSHWYRMGARVLPGQTNVRCDVRTDVRQVKGGRK